MATPRPPVDTPAALLSLLAQAEDPMLLADAPSTLGDDPRVVIVNDAFCRLCGHGPADVTGRGWLALCGERAEAAAIERIKRACFRREHLALNLPLARPDGLEVWTRCELVPLRDARGGANLVLIIQRDISEAKQTQDMLTSLRSMARRASHEVNNGLASVIINLSLVSSARVTHEERQERIRDALNAARDAAETAKRLSAIAVNAAPPPSLLPQPLAPAPSAADANAIQSKPSVSLLGSLLILDDDEAVANLLAGFLSSAGYDVSATREAEHCVELYKRALAEGRPFDLVILDLSIGQGHRRGLTTLRALKEIDAQVKAVAHSGYSNDDVMLHPRQFGFVAAIQKPTAPSEMVRLLGDLIRVHAR